MYFPIAIKSMFDFFSLNKMLSFTQSRLLSLNAVVNVKQEYTNDLKC